MKRSRETFKVEILPDFHQKKELDVVFSAAGGVRLWTLHELIRQYNTVGLYQSEQEIARTATAQAEPCLLECTVRHAVNEAYAQFTELVKSALGGEISLRVRRSASVLAEVPKEEVTFATADTFLRAPYVGLVRFRRNRFITADLNRGGPTENVQWLFSNIRKMFLGSSGQIYFLLVDCREGAAPAVHPRVRRRPRRVPELLK